MRTSFASGFALALLVAGCGAKKLPASDAGTPASPPGDAAVPRATNVAPPVVRDEPPPGFCEQVIPMAEIEKATGLTGWRFRPPTRPDQQGVGECQYYRLGEGGAAATDLLVVWDCRTMHPKLEGSLKALEGTPGLSQVAVGSGGLLVVDDANAANPQRRLLFFLDAPSCAVTVASVGVSGDVVTPLAAVVAKSLK